MTLRTVLTVAIGATLIAPALQAQTLRERLQSRQLRAGEQTLTISCPAASMDGRLQLGGEELPDTIPGTGDIGEGGWQRSPYGGYAWTFEVLSHGVNASNGGLFCVYGPADGPAGSGVQLNGLVSFSYRMPAPGNGYDCQAGDEFTFVCTRPLRATTRPQRRN
ncbi:hypothetical protein V0U79_00980 [Hyphobacterium sp. HN65]|uniref:Secreted protein n=1 Tax=Hyphobacterium lacteum TaxID=3116575 RepID=A0ABU7LNK7_9PROT|nr:hypothetical protein [Hyphobacterium sp. HN65]MEE2524924.1 hypothetical protein [Hyphobacterium sp. HN65]